MRVKDLYWLVPFLILVIGITAFFYQSCDELKQKYKTGEYSGSK